MASTSLGLAEKVKNAGKLPALRKRTRSRPDGSGSG